MAVTPHTFTKLGLSLAQKKIDLTSDTFKALFVNGGAVGGVRDTAQFVSDVKAIGSYAESAASGGYTAGGVTLAGYTYTIDVAGHSYVFTFPALAIGTGTTATFIVFFDSTPGTDATNPVIEYWDLGGSQVVASLVPSSSGLLIVQGS
jgi:hypothetical protein